MYSAQRDGCGVRSYTLSRQIGRGGVSAVNTTTIAIAVMMTLPALLSVTGGATDVAPAIVPETEAQHYSASDPVEIGLAALGSPALGSSFTLEANAVATWLAIDAATISVALPPEIASDDGTKRVVDLRLGEPVTQTFALTPLAEGTHALQVSATGSGPDGMTLGGERAAYVVIPAKGDGSFHLDLPPREGPRTISAPAAAKADGGALLVALASEKSGGAGAGAAIPPTLPPEAPHASLETGGETSEKGGDRFSTLSHSTFQVKVCWFYENEASPPVDTPQRGATIQVWDEDDFSDDLLAQGVTGSDGCYTSGNIGREDTDGGAGNQDVFVRIHLCDTWVCVQDSDEDFYVWRVDYGTVGGEDLIDLGGYKPVGGDNFGGRAFQYAYNAAWFAANVLQAAGWSNSGPQVTIWAPSTDDSCGTGMFFRRSENRIHICSASDRSPEDVGHEYGHWVHWALYGQSFWPSPGGPHNLCTDGQNRGLSWTEGWGNFYGPRVGLDVTAPGTDNNVNYDRPWDGSSFSINMETGGCAGNGDDNEMRVAHTLWDIRDSADDGFDTGGASAPFLASVVAACDNSNFRDFFDGGSCNWISQGGNACTFMRAAFQNNVDFDDNVPTVSVTSQSSFAWVRGAITLTANAADADVGCTPSVEFRVSENNVCSGSDTLVGNDIFAPYSRVFDTTTIPDDASVWTCAVASDGLKPSTAAMSASHIGVDNTKPNVGLSVSGAPGANGWYLSSVTVTLGCGDALSGVDTIQYSLDGGSFTTYGGSFGIASQGVHTLSLRCWDNAGNLDTDFAVIKIDTIDPNTGYSVVGPAAENGWYDGNVTVTMACTDFVPGSTCFNTQVAVSSPGGGGGIFNYAAPFVLTGDGTHSVAYHSVDYAGNVEATGSFLVPIDTTAPFGSITGATDGTFTYTGAEVLGGVFTNEASLDIHYNASDAASGLQLVSISGDSDAYAGVLNAAGTLTISVPAGLSTWSVVVEDMAGHTAVLGTFDVVSIPPGTFEGGVDPRNSGWWRNVVKSGAYTQTALDDFLPLLNAVSHAFGAPHHVYADVTPANYDEYMGPTPPNSGERVRKELTASWLNVVSGRLPAAQTVDLADIDGWELVVTNTAGSSATTALNVIREVEKRLTESPDMVLLNSIKNMLAELNSGGLNT